MARQSDSDCFQWFFVCSNYCSLLVIVCRVMSVMLAFFAVFKCYSILSFSKWWRNISKIASKSFVPCERSTNTLLKGSKRLQDTSWKSLHAWSARETVGRTHTGTKSNGSSKSVVNTSCHPSARDRFNPYLFYPLPGLCDSPFKYEKQNWSEVCPVKFKL